MSKKTQKPQSQNNPKKPQIVDQQNQPFLRTIAKRIRNINKKLTEIDELKKKGDLKPEQVEKVNRRVEYEQQRSRLEGIADFYREAYAENVEQYRNVQLQEIDSLANAIAILRGSANFKDTERLADLNRALTQSSTVSLTESAKSISEVLRRFANDFKLKKSVETFVTENQVAKQPEQKTEQPAQQEVVPEVKAEEPKEQVQQPAVQQTPVVAQQPVEPEAPVQEQKVEQTQPVAQQVPSEQKPAETQPTEQKPVEGEQRQTRGNNRNRGEYRNRNNNNRDNRGPREYREPRQPREPREPRGEGQGQGQQEGERRRYNPNRQRPNYRPKNEEQVQNQSDSDSSLEREPAMRNFKREEIRQLEDEGFQVVGKPKPKAKEGQKEWHDRTHGRKGHHHHHQAN